MTNEELARRIQGGETERYGELWAQVQGLIAKRVFSFMARAGGLCARYGVTEEDLMQAGFLALVDGVAAYDPTEEYKLTTYLSLHLKNQFAAALGGGRRRNALSPADPLNESASLEMPAGDGEDGLTLMDQIPDETGETGFLEAEERVFQVELRAALETEICRSCTPEQAEVIRCRFFDGETLRCMAGRMGIPYEKIHARQEQGLNRLRSRSRHRLMPFLYPEYYAYSGNSLTAFRNSGASGVERAVERAEEKREKLSQQ